MDSHAEYYREAFEIAMDEAGCWSLVEQMTLEQRNEVGQALAGSAENESLAYYRPSASDRITAIEREWRQRLDEERDRTDAARKGAETAMRRVLRIHKNTPISVTDGGEVYRHDGRTTRIA